ncbi:MAG: rRNA maturation RNase YbeY [Actinobacteria bacterium]|nr:rRNA maturation RNase YbeY [Actinomycetota bacterium]
MEILIDNRQHEVEIDEPLLEKLAKFILVSEKVDDSAELSIVFTDEGEIKELNSRYGGVDKATDVLSFSMLEDSDKLINPDKEFPLLLGDVVICPAVAEKYAAQSNTPVDKELCLLLVHGVLHLLGYDHQTEAEEIVMKERQSELLDEWSDKK